MSIKPTTPENAMLNTEMYIPKCTTLAISNWNSGNGSLYAGLTLIVLAITSKGITKKVTTPKDLCGFIIQPESKKLLV